MEPCIVTDSPTMGKNVELQGCGQVLNGSTNTFTWTDTSNPINPSMRYDLYLDIGDGQGFVDQGPSVQYPTNSWTVAGLPTDGRTITKRLYCDTTISAASPFVQCTCTAANIEPLAKTMDFGADDGFGLVSQAQVNAFNDAGFNFVNGESDLSVVNGALRHRMFPSANGSTRTEFGGKMPDSRCYTVKQTILWEPPADYGGVSNQTTKIGFGLGSSNYVSGGTFDASGWSLRWEQRNGIWCLYSYACDRQSKPGANGTFGADWCNGTQVPVTPGVPQVLEMTVCQNTGSNSDGSVIGTVDGVVIHQDNNVKWQTSDHGICDCRFQQFFGGSDSSWSPSTTQYVQVSDVSYTAIP